MRVTVSVLIACLLTATLAVATPASAEETAQCTEKDYVEGSLRVSRDSDCTLEVVLFEGIICVGGWGGSVEREVKGHEVRAYYCDGGLGDRVADLITIETTSSAPGCKPQDETVLGVVDVEQAHNCRVTVSTQLYDCVWGGSWHETTAGPVTWRDYRCGPPTQTSAQAGLLGGALFANAPSAPAPSTAAAPVDWCEVRDDTPEPLRDPVWGRYDEGAHGECDVDVEPFGACVGGSGSSKEIRVDPLHVTLLVCSPPPGSLPPIS